MHVGQERDRARRHGQPRECGFAQQGRGTVSPTCRAFRCVRAPFDLIADLRPGVESERRSPPRLRVWQRHADATFGAQSCELLIPGLVYVEALEGHGICYQESGPGFANQGPKISPRILVLAERSSPITLLPTRETDRAGPSVYSTRLLNRVSPFQLPAARMTAQAPGILVVDDEWEIRRLVSDILGSEGYLVLPATNGVEALAVVDAARVSLALLDMRMPVLDGWGFARELRERRSELPVIVMSAAVDARQWADDIGAAGCISKPFDLLELLAKVERLVAPPLGPSTSARQDVLRAQRRVVAGVVPRRLRPQS